MNELGIDLTDRKPQLLTRDLAEWADIIVTMGCGDQCPFIPGKRYIDWDLPDPKGQPIDEVRATRDEIARRVRSAHHPTRYRVKPAERLRLDVANPPTARRQGANAPTTEED